MSTRLVKRLAVAAFTFCFCTATFMSLLPVIGPRPNTVHAVFSPTMIAPIIDLVKFLATTFKPKDKSQQSQMDAKTNSIQSAANKLAPYPKFLSDSRTFRIAAENLAQTILLGGTRGPAVADKLWDVLKTEYGDTEKKFEAAFKGDSVRQLIAGSTDLQRAESDCSTAFSSIHLAIDGLSKDATANDKLNAFVALISSANSLASAARTPEFDMVQNTEGLVTEYGQLATDLKKSSPPKKGDGSTADAHQGTFLSVRFLLGEGQGSEKASSGQPDFLKQMQADIQKPVELPPWAVAIEAEKPSGPGHGLTPFGTRPISAGVGFAGGLIVGVVGLAGLVRVFPQLLGLTR